MNGTGYVHLAGSDDRPLLPRHVKHALDYMRCNMGEKITLSGLASACAVPERTLLKQFERFLGQPPLAYLRRLRLNAARSELVNPDTKDTTSDIANRCGISHLGRFATEYRRRFGETPSATRQRVRVRAVNGAAVDCRGSYLGDSATSSFASVAGGEKPSLLVFPLRTETLQESREARDLTERLAASLSQMRIATVALVHPCRTQSMNAHQPQPRNAGAQYRLLGRLVQRNERTRVIVGQTDIAADRHVWGDSFDGSVNDPFELQDRVVDAVLCGVVGHITDAEFAHACGKDPNAVTVRELAMQALPLILNTNVASAQKAVSILNRAIEQDPANALPVALLACCQAQLGNYYGTTSPTAVRATAMQLACRAGVLDDSDPLVTLARGATAAMSLQSHEADALVTRALAMDPTCAWAWERHGVVRLSSGGDPDCAIADFTRALKLRGPSLSRGNCFGGIAGAHAAAGRLENAMLWQRRALAENPAATWMYIPDSCYALKAGDWSRVVAGVECMRRAQPQFSVAQITATYPPADPVWLDAVTRAGMPLT